MTSREQLDMHTHTVFSDGTTTPEDNVRDAVARGLAGLAITDHDTGDGVARTIAAAPEGFLVIPGTEFSAELDGVSVHILAYWPDFTFPAFHEELHRLRNERALRAEKIVERFNALDVAITIEQVNAHAAGAPIGRPHIAQAVVDVGAARDIREVFDRYLYDNGPCYVAKYALDPIAAVSLIRDSGGVAVLAHPGLFGHDGMARDTIAAMVDVGLAGIEAAHPSHTKAHHARYVGMAKYFGITVTAGSDYHGATKQVSLGDATTGRSEVERLNAQVLR
jgi:3',5'-nucleoside bisphosphate phosphatase